MKSDLAAVFNFLISQWSFTPAAFKDAIINAALAKFVLSVLWWMTRLLVARFPQNGALALLNRFFKTRPAKLVILILDVTLIDVFLFFAVVALIDLRAQFSMFSLWSAALFSARYGLAPGGVALLLEDDRTFGRCLQRFLTEHAVPHELPLYDARGRYLFAAPGKVGVLAEALTRAVGRGRDNELFVLLADFLEIVEHLGPVLGAVKVALAPE